MPFELTPCQAFVTACLFGWRRKDNGLRRFRRAYVSWARKNGKTTWAAGMGLQLLAFDEPEEMGAQIYCAATKEDQAGILHREAIAMVEQSPSLHTLCTVNRKNIAYLRNRSFFRPLGSDSKTNAGWNPHGIFLDEVCDWQEHHRGLWEALTTAGGARRQPLQLVICTAGNDESQLWNEEDEFAIRVLEQAVAGQRQDDSYFAFIARIDDERMCEHCRGNGCDRCNAGVLAADDPFDERCWIKANPNLGTSVKLEYLREQANIARLKPTSRNAFIRYHCNRRVSSDEKPIAMDLWNLCGCEPLSDWSSGIVCGGFDLGRKSDLASIALVCKLPDGQDDEGRDIYRYEMRQLSFTHEEVDLPLSQEPWRTFAERGELRINSGNAIDLPGSFKEALLEWHDLYRVEQWAYDPHNAVYLGLELANTGITVMEFAQNCGNYNEPLEELLRCIRARTFRHGHDYLLSFAASNLVIHSNIKDEWMPAKRRSAQKIDPIVAGLMAFAMALRADFYWQPTSGVAL